MKSKFWMLPLALIAVLALTVLGMSDRLPARERLIAWLGVSQPAPPAQAARAPQRAPVETARVAKGAVDDNVQTIGSLTANETVTIAPEIAGRITALNFEEGGDVKKGQALVELDSAILEGEVKQAQADLSLADDAYERASQLAKRGAGTVVALEQASAQRLAARVKVELARARLEKATLRTPFAGVAGLRTISVGNFVNAGQAIVSVTSIDPIKVDFRVPELFLGDLKDGQQVDVAIDALPGRSFKGVVYAIDPVVDVNGRAVRVRARIDNKDRTLAPGLFARVTLTIGRDHNAILMPESALVAQESGGVVFVVEEGVARRREVKIGKRMEGQVQVLDGLAAGELVVTAGQVRLRDGAPVDVLTAQAKTNG